MLFSVGDFFEQRFVISEMVYNSFLQTFKDQNPLHTQADFAVLHGFRDKVMHGNILNGFLSFFIGECLPTKNVIIHSQEIQYKKPVYLHEELNFTAEVTGVYESVNAIEFKFGFKNTDGQMLAKGKFQIGVLK